MNVLLLLSTLFTIAMAQRNCCPYPVTISVNSAVPSPYDFQCSEPVMLSCVKSGPTFSATAIAPFNGSYEVQEKDLLVTGSFIATGTFSCNTTTRMWTKGDVQFPGFDCAYKQFGGSWTF